MDPERGRGARLVVGLLVAGVVLSLVPVWMGPWFPSQDGPIHVHLVVLWRELLHGASPLIERFHEISSTVEPNLLGYLLLYALVPVVGPAAAEKLLVSLVIVAFAAGGDRLVTAISREARGYALFLLPLAAGLYVHLGFYNFALGSAFALWGLAAWWRRLRDPDPPGARFAVALGVFGTLLALTHMLPFLLFGLTVAGTHGVMELIVRRRPGGTKARLVAMLRGDAVIAAGLLPGMLLVISFLLRHGVGGERLAVGHGPADRALHALLLWPASSFDLVENLACLPLLVALFVLVGLRLRDRIRQRGPEPGDAWLAAFVGLSGFFLFGNLSSKGVPVADRLLPMVHALLVAWLATGLPSRRARRFAVAAGAATVLLLGGVRIGLHARVQTEMADYLSVASEVREGRTLLALNFVLAEERELGTRLRRVDPFQHASSRIALERAGVDLRSSLLSTRVFGYFPVVYREEVDPYRYLGMHEWGIEAVPPFVSFDHYEHQTGERIDYVLVRVGDPAVWAEMELADRLARQLALGYHEKARSASGHAILFERRPDPQLP